MENKKTELPQQYSQFELTKHLIVSLANFEITPVAKLVLLYLSSCYNSSNVAVYPKIQTIADTLGIGLTAAKTAISDLIKKGLILKIKEKNRNSYVITAVNRPENNEVVEIRPKRKSISDHSTVEIRPSHDMNKQVNKKTEQKESDFSLLKSYAISKGADNPEAYARTLEKNGPEELLKSLKNANSRNAEMQSSTEKTKQNLAEWEENAGSPLDFSKDEALKYVTNMHPEARIRSYFAKELIKKWDFELGENVSQGSDFAYSCQF